MPPHLLRLSSRPSKTLASCMQVSAEAAPDPEPEPEPEAEAAQKKKTAQRVATKEFILLLSFPNGD